MFFGDLKNRRRAEGFTLIELLVVVAIIALLLSILLPSLERARAQARQVIDLTNLRSQGQAALLYSEDNDGFIPRGLQRHSNPTTEYHTYATTILKYLGYDGFEEELWDANGGSAGSGGRPNPLAQRRIRLRLREFGEQFQCPDYPDDAHNGTYRGRGAPETQLLDYVSSAIPMPYSQDQIDFDEAGGGQAGDTWEGSFSTPVYVGTSKISYVEQAGSPARLIHVTEGHVSLGWDDFAFHHFFLTSQLPFGAHPRIASDQRHPGGITALFFDSHATVMSPKKMDVGWPNSLGLRLSFLTSVPEQYR